MLSRSKAKINSTYSRKFKFLVTVSTFCTSPLLSTDSAMSYMDQILLDAKGLVNVV